MPRLTLDYPESVYCFRTAMQVRVTEINSARHAGNDALVSMISEARARFFHDQGFSEGSDARVNVIAADLAVVYQGQAMARDRLRFDLGMTDFNRYGGDVVCRIVNADSGAPVLISKTGIVFFDYVDQKVAPIPEEFRARFPAA